MSSECCIHIVDDENDKLLLMSFKSQQKIKYCIEQWMLLDGKEKVVAEKLNELSDFKNDAGEITVLKGEYAYHRKCYMRFTDTTRIEKAKKRFEKSSSSAIVSESHGKYSRNSVSCVRNAGTTGIFSDICIICRKEQYILEKHSSKRKKEKLSKCQTFNASKALLDSAMRKNDEIILCQIRGIDCIAKEVKYHNSCYKAYTKLSNFIQTNKEIQPHAVAYSTFCDNIILKRIINNSEILPMNKLTKLYEKTVQNLDPSNVSLNVSNRQLKRWLLRDYPELIFVKPRQRNMSELVMCMSADNGVTIINDEKFCASSSSESDDFDIISSQLLPNKFDEDIKQMLYRSAFFLRGKLNESPSLNCSWPPIAQELTEEAACRMIPPHLFNFLAWCVGATDEVQSSDMVHVEDKFKTKLLCIAQDIVYLASRGRKPTPKHYSLAMSMRHLTGSSKVIDILNGLGHSISHSSVLEYDTALAEMQLQAVDTLPIGLKHNVFTTLVWDNIDFNEETLTGHGTTHSTNGIVIQRKGEEVTEVMQKLPNKTKRTINPPVMPFSEFNGVKKCGPKVELPSINETLDQISISKAKMSDAAFILCKVPALNIDTLPGWTGFNTKVQSKNIPPVSIIRYLPVIEANPVQLSTVYTLLLKSLDIANKLELETIILVFDQALYAKAQQICWQEEEFKKRFVVRLGEFHISLCFLAVLGKRYKDAGLANIMVESGIVSEGSINGVMSGKHYNRSLRAHKLVFEAISRLLWNEYLDSVSETQLDEINKIAQDIQKSYSLGCLDENALSTLFLPILEKFNEFVSQSSNLNPTFKFWVSYLETVGILLRFIRATRVGDWTLHLASISEMIPWIFAYDRVNYARYLPVYMTEMVNLREKHPSVHQKMLEGEFVVHRQNSYGFSGTACDQIIEQTANRDSKTKGGMVGLTNSQGAVHRWMLSHHLRAQISLVCEELARKNRGNHRNKKELDNTRIKKDETSVCSVVSTISSMINPFKVTEDGIVNVSSGMIASTEIQKDLETALVRGVAAYDQFRKTCVKSDGSINIFSPIKLQKLLTFSDAGKSALKIRHKSKAYAMTTANLLARIIVTGQSTELDMKNIMTYSLSPYPPSISNSDGSLAKTNKAALSHFLLNLMEPHQTLCSIPKSEKIVLIIDGMEVIQQMRHIPETFGAYALQILQNIVNMGIRHGAQRIDFITDRYPEISIKNQERNRRATKDCTDIKIVNRDQKTPKQFKKFLSNGKNKERLVEFLYEEWSRAEANVLQNLCVVIAHGEKCHSLASSNGMILTQELSQLSSDHEEADTRMLLHAHQVSEFADTIIIRSSDTDVFILCLSMNEHMHSSMYLMTGTNCINVSHLSNILGKSVCSALIGLHVFTGCDSTSAFKGKGKIKAFKLMQKNDIYVNAFQQLGQLWDINCVPISVLELFVCELYSQPHCKSVNDARYTLFKLKLTTDTMLPPNYDSFFNHIKRCNYQACVHRMCLNPIISAPIPTSESGWFVEENYLKVIWNSIPQIPDNLLKQVSCACRKSTCATRQCSCKAANIFCTDICSCVDCSNIECDEDEHLVLIQKSDSEDSDIEYPS